MTRKKILIVTSFFEKEIGYQEVQIARVLYAMGHDLMVLTTNRSYLHKERRLRNDGLGYPVSRISRMLRIRDTVLPLQPVKREIAAFNPDVVMLIHPGHGLGYFVLKAIPERSRVVSFFGDLRNDNKLAQAEGFKGNPFIQRVLKDGWYRKVLHRSDVVVANTNETSGILREIDGAEIASKLIMPGLGYDPEVYGYRPSLGKEWRKEMGLHDEDVVVVTVTRVIPGKPVHKWLEPVLSAMEENPRIVYILAGFMENPYSSELKTSLEQSKLGKRLRLLNFTDAAYNNKMFNGADYSLWFAPTTSIQQSMASGLSAILPFETTLDHLVTQGVNGLYYETFEELRNHLVALGKPSVEREAILGMNKKFSYESILNSIVAKLSRPTQSEESNEASQVS